MNYLAHGWRFTADPYFLAGTATPDWLNVIDRKMRTRSKKAKEFTENVDPHVSAVARGIVQHHFDDDWFHQSRAFQELNLEFTVLLKQVLPADDSFRPSFVGHILVELLLDAALAEAAPSRLDDYYGALSQLDGGAVQAAINLLATRQSDQVSYLLARFLGERFLYDYLEDAKLLTRLNHVMRRVGLPLLPAETADLLPAMRATVRRRAKELLAQPTLP